ncbi:MAG: glycoside hydrolase [Pirellulaceae bacterium]
MSRSLAVLLMFLTFVPGVVAGQELIKNGDFEQQDAGWGKFWSRTGEGQAEFASTPVHGGQQAAHIEYGGAQDWSFPQAEPLQVEPGDIFELSGWLQTRGEGQVTLSVILYDSAKQSLSWSFGGTGVSQVGEWRQVRSRFVIPRRGATIMPRLMGYGPAEVWLDDVSLIRTGSIDALKSENLPERLTLSNPLLEVTFHPQQATLTVTDRRTGREYQQESDELVVVLSARPSETGIVFQLLKPDDVLTIDGALELDPVDPEFVVQLTADRDMQEPLRFPAPFVTKAGEYLIMPVNEGISYPVDDESLPPMRYHLAGGHGLCMGFWGCTDLTQGLMALVETPDDAAVNVTRSGGRLSQAPEWLPQKGRFGLARRMRYVVFESGGYVAMCKRYRQYAQQNGLFKTLDQKRSENPHVDLLVGAVNVWCWDRPAPEMCEEMRKLGIERILWSNRSTPEQIQQLNEMRVLSSRYDIYQDVMDPANFSKLRYVHSDWTSDAWPNDIILREDGSWATGWAVEGKAGEWYQCGVLCDSVAVDYARRRVPLELETHPYRCRFIDTTTASEWRECYHPNHPMTRSDSRRFRMKLLEYMSQTLGLVTGSETGHDAAVPFVHYFEGMLSLGPYRVPDAGRDMLRVWNEVPESLAKFQTGHYYRLPLWELVYHDCVVSQWYWGDYNNKLPAVWPRRDLFNALYGTPPMFMFNRAIWRENRERFVESYQAATPVARATGYSEMISHRWLTADHAVQQTQFANGIAVTVNFGDAPYTMPDGTVLEPLSQRREGMPNDE